MLWYIHTGAYPHPCMLVLALTHVCRQSVLPRDVLDIRVWVSPTFNLVSSYSRVLQGADLRSNSRYSLTQQGCAHRGIPHSLSRSLLQTIGSSVMYFRVFTKIFEFQMYTLGHTLSQFFCGYWMLWIRVEGFSSGMDVCDISSFLTLTLCAVVGF